MEAKVNKKIEFSKFIFTTRHTTALYTLIIPKLMYSQCRWSSSHLPRIPTSSPSEFKLYVFVQWNIFTTIGDNFNPTSDLLPWVTFQRWYGKLRVVSLAFKNKKASDFDYWGYRVSHRGLVFHRDGNLSQR